MVKLTCGCLNVEIHVKCRELKPSDVQKLGINTCANPDEFFQLDIAEVPLDLEGIRIEHSCLVKQRQWQDWKIHRCLNCDLLTHAINTQQGNSQVLVNTSLKSDPTIQESLLKSPEFSPLYKIVIHNRNDNYQVKSLGLESGEYESLQEVLSSIQKQLNTFLIQEEAAMEDRIRSYEEEQRSKYAELQSKVRRDKNVLISLVLAAEEESETTNNQQENYKNPPEMKPVEKPTLLNKLPSRTDAKKPKVTAVKQSAKRPLSNKDDLDELDVFDLDDMQDDNRPFYTSDDDNDDTDDSTNDDVFGRDKNPNAYLSSSMPISMQHWRQNSTSRSRAISNISDDEEEEKEIIPDHQDMAASIKALAQSVHGDGTEIFGDLPRRRINTLDMGNL